MATYDNPILNFAERYPMAGFFVLPVAIHYGAVWFRPLFAKAKQAVTWVISLVKPIKKARSLEEVSEQREEMQTT